MKKSDRRLANRYLNLLEAALVGTLYGDPPDDTWSGKQYDARARALGQDWPSLAQTMIGTVRMRNLRHLCEEAIFNEIPGDFVETGVWRGGACIYMRGILNAMARPVAASLQSTASKACRRLTRNFRPMPATLCIRAINSQFHALKLRIIFDVTDCWTTKSCFLKAGSRTRCPMPL